MENSIGSTGKEFFVDKFNYPLAAELVPKAFNSIKKNKLIKELFLHRQPRLDSPELIKLLVNTIQSNPRIKTLKLDDNLIGPDGAQILAEMIEKNTTLEHFSIYNQNIKDKGTVFLARALEKNKTIRKCSFGYSGETDLSGRALAKMLRINQSLESFTICYCKFSVDCLTELIETLRTHRLKEFINFNTEKSSFTSRPNYLEYYTKLDQILDDNQILTTFSDNHLSVKMNETCISMYLSEDCATTTSLKKSVLKKVRRNQKYFKFKQNISPFVQSFQPIFKKNIILYMMVGKYLSNDDLDDIHQHKCLKSLLRFYDSIEY
tara:strand:- start:96 stop:1055 length:960 start_codon:yes stop_codon:yes gene_type:complete